MSSSGDRDIISDSDDHQLLNRSELRFRSQRGNEELSEKSAPNMAPSRVTSGYGNGRNISSYSSSAEYHRVGDENRPKPVYTSLQVF